MKEKGLHSAAPQAEFYKRNVVLPVNLLTLELTSQAVEAGEEGKGSPGVSLVSGAGEPQVTQCTVTVTAWHAPNMLLGAERPVFGPAPCGIGVGPCGTASNGLWVLVFQLLMAHLRKSTWSPSRLRASGSPGR